MGGPKRVNDKYKVIYDRHFNNRLSCRRKIARRSKLVEILHRFRDTTTFTVHVTACDLEKSFNFDKTVEVTRHVRSPIHVQTNRS